MIRDGVVILVDPLNLRHPELAANTDFTALHHPESFGVAIMQSPSCWYAHRDQTEGDLVGTKPVPALIQEFLDAEETVLDQLRLYQECGMWEFGPPPARVW